MLGTLGYRQGQETGSYAVVAAGEGARFGLTYDSPKSELAAGAATTAGID
jgi:hypothetical protein